MVTSTSMYTCHPHHQCHPDTRNIQEFLKLTEFAERGSIKEKLAWTFKLYDKDMSGGGTHSESINEGRSYASRNYNCQGNAGGHRDSDYHGGAQ